MSLREWRELVLFLSKKTFISFIYLTMVDLEVYEKQWILEQINETFKEQNPDYKLTKKLINKNKQKLLHEEKQIEDYSEKVNKKLYEEFEKEMSSEDLEKSRLTFSRWLSDGSLECEFLAPNWETFTKVYADDSVFAKRQEERELKEIEQEERERFQKSKFGDLIFWVGDLRCDNITKKSSVFGALL